MTRLQFRRSNVFEALPLILMSLKHHLYVLCVWTTNCALHVFEVPPVLTYILNMNLHLTYIMLRLGLKLAVLTLDCGGWVMGQLFFNLFCTILLIFFLAHWIKMAHNYLILCSQICFILHMFLLIYLSYTYQTY